MTFNFNQGEPIAPLSCMTSIYTILGATKEEILEVINNINLYYYTYPITKKSGKLRYINAPTGILKVWQKILLHEVFYNEPPHVNAHGFTKRKSPVTAALKHINRKLIVSVDIKNFFPTITLAKLKKRFKYLTYKNNTNIHAILKNEEQTELLLRLITYKGSLPQGTSTSPAVSNLFMRLFDNNLTTQLKRFDEDIVITRYADDITVSTNKETVRSEIIIHRIEIELKKNNLVLNKRKTHTSVYSKRQQVLGIVVNQKLNTPKEKHRNLRAELHNLKMSKTLISVKEAQQLRGRIEWQMSLNSKKGEQFLKEFGLLNFSNT